MSAASLALISPPFVSGPRQNSRQGSAASCMHQPGIEPGSHQWQRCILPLDHWCFWSGANTVSSLLLGKMFHCTRCFYSCAICHCCALWYACLLLSWFCLFCHFCHRETSQKSTATIRDSHDSALYNTNIKGVRGQACWAWDLIEF